MDTDSFKSMFHSRLLSRDSYVFTSLPSQAAITDRVEQFVRRTGLQDKTSCCIICSRHVQSSHTETYGLTDIPNIKRLRPAIPHDDHELCHGALLYFEGVENDALGSFGCVCRQCIKSLKSDQVPSLSLAAGNWVGEKIAPLAGLSLAEKMLIARQPGAMYIIHREGTDLDIDEAIGMNDDTYREAPPSILDIMPMTMKNLTYFFRVNNPGVSFSSIPDCLRVHRVKVEAALRWLKDNNAHYHDITISDERLALLPQSGVPKELVSHLMWGSGGWTTSWKDALPFKIKIHEMVVPDADLMEPATRSQTFARMFPWLFPMAASGLSMDNADMAVSAKWFLFNTDSKYRTDEVFIAKMYALVIAAKIQRVVLVKRHLLNDFFDEYLKGPGRQETLRALVNCTKAALTDIPGSDISRISIERKFWSITLMKGPPTFHFFIDLIDILPHHPLSSGEAQPNGVDPYPLLRRLHHAVVATLEDLFGINTLGSSYGTTRRAGVLGKVAAFLTSIDVQRSSTLGVNIVIWITNSPTFRDVQMKLWCDEFRRDLAAYCIAAFKNMDSASGVDGNGFDCEQLNPALKKKVVPCPWNRDLMKAAKVMVDAKLLLDAAAPSELAREMSRPVMTVPSVLSQAEAALACVRPSSTDTSLGFARRLVESTVKACYLEREISIPLMMNYIMGWTDTSASHAIVDIKLDDLRNVVVNANDELRAMSVLMDNIESQRDDASPISSASDENLLADYAARGYTMEDHNLLDFVLFSEETNDKHLRWMKRWRYMVGNDRDERSRVDCRKETLPHFTGKWFPNLDNAATQDLHYAMVLALLMPWRDAGAIKKPDETWEIAHAVFRSHCGKEVANSMDNIQFYHTSAKAAAIRRL